jgi:hypothetical protein
MGKRRGCAAPYLFGAGEPIYTKPVATAADAFYEVSIDQVRPLAEASDIRLRTTGASPASYELWDTRQSVKGSIRAFLAEVDF